MSKLFVTTSVLALSFAVSGAALAGTGLSGPHYNLNIIGVENPKSAKMTGSNRHTIFVDLGKQSQVTSNIYLTPAPQGEDFAVCDGNAFDEAYDCSGAQIQNQGAVFQLPCNTNLTQTDGETMNACDGEYALAYQVWVRELGKPNGEATMTTCADEVEDVNGNMNLEHICSTENVLLVRNVGKGNKPIFRNVTNELTSLCVDNYTDSNYDGSCDARYALFRNELEDWVWEYQNRGLRLAQLRFYILNVQ